MAVARDWQDFVVEQLAGIGRVSARRMFGGVGLWVDETFFGLIASSHDVFFKVDDGNREAYERAGMGPFRPFADKGYTMSYWQVPPDVLEDPDEASAWARDAIAAARRARRRPRDTGRSRRRAPR